MYQKPMRGQLINRTHPLVRGLVGAWLFNDGDGSNVWDQAYRHDNGGGLTGTASWRHGGAVNLNGTDEWVTFGATKLPISDMPFTVTIINRHRAGHKSGAFTLSDGSTTNDQFEVFGGTAANKTGKAIQKGDAAQSVTTTRSIANLERVIVTATFVSATLRSVWANTEPAAWDAVSDSGTHTWANMDRMNIGVLVQSGADEYSDSYGFEALYLWNRDLLATEVSRLHANPFQMWG
jgi:hypothetical protein